MTSRWYELAYHVCLFTAIGAAVVLGYNLKPTATWFTMEDEPQTTVACTSNSMGSTVSCMDKVYADDTHELREGSIYVFRSPYDENHSSTAIHRLVACTTIDDRIVRCSEPSVEKVLFKGDANLVADPLVNKSDVLYRVRMVEYR